MISAKMWRGVEGGQSSECNPRVKVSSRLRGVLLAVLCRPGRPACLLVIESGKAAGGPSVQPILCWPWAIQIQSVASEQTPQGILNAHPDSAVQTGLTMAVFSRLVDNLGTAAGSE